MTLIKYIIMELTLLFLIMTLCTNTALANFAGRHAFHMTIKEETYTESPPANCDELEDCRGKNKHTPICGTNGKTFSSLCKYRKAVCRGDLVKFKHKGECTSKEKCADQRRAAIESKKHNDGGFVPQCNSDGTFQRVQCHEKSGFCWCTNSEGIHDQTRAIFNSKPNCTDLQSTTKTVSDNPTTGKLKPLITPDNLKELPQTMYIPLKGFKGNKKRFEIKRATMKGCSGKLRRSFFTEMLQLLKKEFINRKKSSEIELAKKSQHTSNDSNPKNQGNKPTNFEIEVIEWKFDSLDKRKDGKLRKNEYKNFRKLVKRKMKPIKCAKVFPTICDTDKDNHVTLQEWRNCFGTKSGRKKKKGPRGGGIKKPTRKIKGAPKTRIQPRVINVTSIIPACKRELEEWQEVYSTGNVSQYKVKCDNSGLFEPIQCFGSTEEWYCFCVQRNTGKMIQKSEVQGGTPDCSAVLDKWPGCPNETVFLENLMEHLIYKVQGMVRKKQEEDEKRWKKLEIATKFFSLSDENKNGKLEGNERKYIRRIIKKSRMLEKCDSNLVEICDTDKDDTISITEWIECIVSTKSRQSYGCPNQINFLKNLMQHLLYKVQVITRKRQEEEEKRWTHMEIAAKFFTLCDENKNGKLEGNERKYIRRIIKKNSLLEKCGSNMVDICDTDKDDKISMVEWIDCIVSRKPPGPRPVGFPEKIHNPTSRFDVLLKADP